MASISALQAILPATSVRQCSPAGKPSSLCGVTCSPAISGGSSSLSWNNKSEKKKRHSTVVNAVGDVSADGTTYLIAGAVVVAILGTGFPILFSRKDICPVCDGAGFVRKGDVTLRANAARKDQTQIVCANCNGLGKLNQVDK